MRKEVDWQKVKEKQLLASEKKKAKLADPAFRQKQIDKANDQSKRQFERQLEKRSSPEYKQAQYAKQKEAQARAFAKAKLKSGRNLAVQESTSKLEVKPRVKSKAKSKGMVGRTPTAVEKRIMNAIGSQPCVCCALQGYAMEEDNKTPISLHHVEGRTKPWAHAMVLPLCQYHHDQPAPLGAPEWLFPLHGTGSKPWEEVNGTQEYLLEYVFKLAGIDQPWIDVDSNTYAYCEYSLKWEIVETIAIC
jgi:hypothetical protein